MITRDTLYSVVLCALFSPIFCLGADYYVDASGGNDGNAGTSTTAAWKTVGKVNGRSFSPGDRILFKRGETWREQLVVPSSGAAGKPITFGAYGSGNRPTFKGSALPSGWTNAGGSLWKASLSSSPSQVFFNGVRGTRVGGSSSVNGANKWYWSGGTLYVYSGSNPGASVEASVRPSTRSYGLVHVTNCSYVNIESLNVTQSSSFGLYIKPAASYITVRDCEVSQSIDGGLVAPSSNGSGCSQLTIEDCSVHHNNTGYIGGGVPGTDTYHEGLTMERVNGFVIRRTKVFDNYMEGSNFKRGATNGLIEYCDLYSNDLINQYIEGATNIEIRYNRIYDCSYNAGIEFGMETDTYNNDNVKIHHNLFWNNSGGVSFWAGNFTGQHRNIRIENNTFYNNWEAIRWKAGATDNYSGTNYIRDNLFWQGSGSNRAIWDYTSGQQAIGRTNIAYNAFQQGAASATTGSNAKMISDAMFTSASGLDFRLRTGSPCINAGTSVGWTTDFAGTSIPQGGVPDIGAYEFASGGGTPTPTTYTLSVGAANGAVTRNPNKTSYTAGETVTLQATANSGYTFTGWSGDLSGSTNPATLTMSANRSVTAGFAAINNGGTTTNPGTKTVGNTSVLTGVATAMNRRAVPYTMPEAGQLQSLSIYHNAGSGQMLLGVYSDSSGLPGSRLAVTNAVNVNGSEGWQTVTLQSPVSVSAGQRVWLAWVLQNAVGIRATAGTPGRAEASATWSGGMPTAFGSATTGGYVYSIYATYTAGSVTPPPATYMLTTSAANGAVTRSPNKTSYAAGETVTLQATANSGYIFTGWSGALTGTTNPATLVMNSNKSVTANFTAGNSGGTPTPTIRTVGNTSVLTGVATAMNRRAVPYTMPEAGQLQSLSIYHNGGSGQMLLGVYTDSSGLPGSRLGVTNAVNVNGSQGWQTVTLQSPVSVTAGQKIWLAWVLQNTVGVRATGGTPGRAEASATWSGGMPAAFGSASTGGYVYSVYATYTTGSGTPTPAGYTLTVGAANGTVTRSPNQTSYAAGATVTLQATANSGYTFTGWSGALSGNANPATLVMDSNKSVTANFTAAVSNITRAVGNQSVLPGVATAMNRRAVPYTMPEAGQLQSVSIYHNGGSGQMLMGVYADSAGRPGSRLSVTNAVAVNGSEGWQTVTLQSPVSVSAGQKVWLSWVLQNPVGVRATAGAPGRAEASATWSGGMPATFGSTTVGNYNYSVYATYRPMAVSALTLPSDVESMLSQVSDPAVKTADAAAASKSNLAALCATFEKPGTAPAARVSGRSMSLSRGVCLDEAGRNQGKPATVADAQGNAWVLWHAGNAGERQVFASFFQVPGLPASLCS